MQCVKLLLRRVLTIVVLQLFGCHYMFMELSRTNLQHFTDFRMALFRNFANHVIKKSRKLNVFL